MILMIDLRVKRACDCLLFWHSTSRKPFRIFLTFLTSPATPLIVLAVAKGFRRSGSPLTDEMTRNRGQFLVEDDVEVDVDVDCVGVGDLVRGRLLLSLRPMFKLLMFRLPGSPPTTEHQQGRCYMPADLQLAAPGVPGKYTPIKRCQCLTGLTH